MAVEWLVGIFVMIAVQLVAFAFGYGKLKERADTNRDLINILIKRVDKYHNSGDSDHGKEVK
jgi:hypothetical protein